jgi:uncharacterized protein YodC (DUF2158 family)
MSVRLKAGDVVTTSGRPNMTVEEAEASGRRVKCQWFDRKGRFHEEKFFVSALVLVPTEEAS